MPCCRAREVSERFFGIRIADPQGADEAGFWIGDHFADGLELVGARPKVHLHVRLPAGVPDLADEKVANLESLRSRSHGQPVAGSVGFQRSELQLPLTVVSRGNYLGLTGELDCYRGAGFGHPPHRDRHSLLQHAVVRKNPSDAQFFTEAGE